MSKTEDFLAGLLQAYGSGYSARKNMKNQIALENYMRERDMRDQISLQDYTRQREGESQIANKIAIEEAMRSRGLGPYAPEPTEAPFPFTGEIMPAFTNKTGYDIQNGLPMPVDMQVPTDFGYVQTGPDKWEKIDMRPEEDPALAAVRKEQALMDAGLKMNPVLKQAQDSITERIDTLVESNQPVPQGLLDEHKKVFGYDYEYRPYANVTPSMPDFGGGPGGYTGGGLPGFDDATGGRAGGGSDMPVLDVPTGANPMKKSKAIVQRSVDIVKYGPLPELAPEAAQNTAQRVKYDNARAKYNEAYSSIQAELEYQSTLTESPEDAAKLRESKARMSRLSADAVSARNESQLALEPDKEQKKKNEGEVAAAKKEILGKLYNYQGGDPLRYTNYYSHNDAAAYIDSLDIPASEKKALKAWTKAEWNKSKKRVDEKIAAAKESGGKKESVGEALIREVIESRKKK